MTTDKLLEAAQTEALLRGHVMSAMDRFRTKHGIQDQEYTEYTVGDEVHLHGVDQSGRKFGLGYNRPCLKKGYGRVARVKTAYSKPWFVPNEYIERAGTDVYGRIKRISVQAVASCGFATKVEDMGPCVLLHKENYRRVML